MKAVLVFNKCLKQQLRDKISFSLSLLTVPFFVIFYWFCCSGQTDPYTVVISNSDQGCIEQNRTINYGQELISHLQEASSMTEKALYITEILHGQKELNQALINRNAAIGLIIPPGFSEAISKDKNIPPVVQLKGDASLSSYYMTKNLIVQVLYSFQNKKSLKIEESTIGLSGSRSPFEIYVPGLLVFAVIMMIFSVSMTIAREIESCNIDRLKMTPLGTMDLLTGISALQLMQGLISLTLTFLVAWALGFRSAGSITYAFLISGIACFASVGTGMVIGAVSKNQNRAFLISSVAMFLLILFSGVVFPRPEVELFQAGGYQVNLFDFLPTTHMAKGLEKILTLGLSHEELVYETVFLAILSISYFVAGILFFKHMVLAAKK